MLADSNLLAKALDDHNPKDNVARPVAKKRIGGALLMHAVYQIHVVRTNSSVDLLLSHNKLISSEVVNPELGLNGIELFAH